MRRATGASAGLIALLALFLHTQFPQSSETSTGREAGRGTSTNAASLESQSRDTEVPMEGPWLATEAFFHVASSAKRPNNSEKERQEHKRLIEELLKPDGAPDDQRLRGLLGLPDKKPEMWSIVASVADPLHTRMSLYFDGQTEAIERSLQEIGWDFVGQWLPAASRSASGASDAEAAKRRWWQRAEEELPGILIFRARPKPGDDAFSGQVLFVLIVPETVTGGVNGPAFYAAMHIAESLSTHKIGLLGPTFSGSFASLSQLVKSWPHQDRFSKTVYSGDVANLDSATTFAQTTGLHFHGGSFDSHDYQTVVCSVLQRYDMHYLALLKEDEGGLAPSLRHSKNEDLNCEFRTYVFPRDIAHLRNAYEDASGESSEQLLSESSPGLSFSIKDPDSGEDSIPVYSEAQTPLTQNAIITSITRDLNRTHTRLVFIVATNALDALFLMRAVRRDCPNARILVENPNILFVSAAAHYPLSGTLLLSSYPMLFTAPSASQAPSFDPDDNLMFSESSLQGLYNVTQLLGSDLGALRVRAVKLRGYSWEGSDRSSTHPGVWLLTLTPFGFSPIDLFEPKPPAVAEKDGSNPPWFKDADHGPEFPIPDAIKPPRSWELSGFIVSMATLVLCLLFVLRNLSSRRGKPFWLAITDRYRPRLQGVIAAGLSLSALMWIIALPDWLPWAKFFIRTQPLLFTVKVVTLAAFLAPLLSLLAVIGVLWKRRQLTIASVRRAGTQPMICATVFGASGLVLFTATLIVWYALCSDRTNPNYSLFVRFRALDLFSGSSPALPLAMLTIAAFCISVFSLKRHSVAGAGRPQLTFPAVNSGDPKVDERANAFRTRMSESYDAINRRADAPVTLDKSEIAWRMIVGATAVVICLFVFYRYSQAFEVPSYNRLLLAGIGLLVFSLAIGCCDLVYLWSSVESFLRLIELLPLQAAIRRVARDWPRRPIWASRRAVSNQSVDRQMLHALHRRRVILQKQGAQMALAAGAGADGGAGAAQASIAVSGTTADKASQQLEDFQQVAFTSGQQTSQEFLEHLRNYHAVGATIASEIYEDDLRPAWRTSLNDEDYQSPRRALSEEEPGQKYLNYSADVVALQFCRYLGYSVAQIQRLASRISLSFVLLVLVSNCYRPQGPQFVAEVLAAMFAASGIVVFWVFARMERNPVLSRIARTQPGQLNREFWIQLITLGGLPLLGVVAHLFPAISTFLIQWIAPTVEGMH